MKPLRIAPKFDRKVGDDVFFSPSSRYNGKLYSGLMAVVVVVLLPVEDDVRTSSTLSM
jgi:hypothetical protein